MAMFVKRKILPVFKKDQQVCFLLPKKNSAGNAVWHFGHIVSFIETKINEDPMVEVLPYEILEHFRPSDTEEEWSSLALVPLQLPLEAIILNRLDGQTRVVNKKSLKTIKLFVKDLCPAVYDHFRAVLMQGMVYSLRSKKTFW